MISLDFLQFDQTNLLFFIATALGLIREKRILPYVIVLVGNLIHGPFAAMLLGALILWHRIDASSSKWIQLKDAIGLFFIFVVAVSPEPFQEFAICLGVLVMSVSFGQGELGVIPPVLLLRQYVPHPPDVEFLLGAAGFYWVASEALRFIKSDKVGIVRSAFEVLCSLGGLVGLQEVFFKWSEDPILISLGASCLLFFVVLGSVVRWKNEWFWGFYRRTKASLARIITVGDRLIASREFRSEELPDEEFVGLHGTFDRLFILAILTLVLVGSFFFINRGGLT